MRFGYPGKLATSVRGRLKRLQPGASPAELQLGHDCSVEQCITLLWHLDARWYQIPRRRLERCRRRRSSSAPAACRPRTSASAAARSSARIPRAGCRSRAQQLQTLGALDRLRSRPRGRRSRLGVGALARDATSGARRSSCARPNASHRWLLDQLVIAARRRRAFASGTSRAWRSRRRTTRRGRQLALTLRLWSGSADGDDAAAAVGGKLRGSAAAGAAASPRRPRQAVPRAAAADVQSEPACCARWTPGPIAAIG